MKRSKIWCNDFIITNYEYEEGETIEEKVRRIVETKEPIEDGAPLIYTSKDQGVIAAYNIRTDRWEIAQDAMSMKYKAEIAKAKNNIETPKEGNTGEGIEGIPGSGGNQPGGGTEGLSA